MLGALAMETLQMAGMQQLRCKAEASRKEARLTSSVWKAGEKSIDGNADRFTIMAPGPCTPLTVTISGRLRMNMSHTAAASGPCLGLSYITSAQTHEKEAREAGASRPSCAL